MARYKVVDRSARFLPISLDAQLMVGSFEHALDVLVHEELELSAFEPLYRNAESGAPARVTEGGNLDRAFICSLWVAPAWRRSGAASALVAEAARWLRQRGACSIYAWVAEGNTSAKRFYASVGFTATPQRQRLPSNPEEWEVLLEHNAPIGA